MTSSVKDLKLRGECTDVAISQIPVARKLQSLWERQKKPSEFVKFFTRASAVIHDFVGYRSRSVRVIKRFRGKIQVLVRWWQLLSYAQVKYFNMLFHVGLLVLMLKIRARN